LISSLRVFGLFGVSVDFGILGRLPDMCVYDTDLCMARTTLLLDDTQMMRLKNLARAESRTMTDLINEFIAEGLAARAVPKPEQALSLPIFDMGRPRVNLADREALEAMME
jgi:hypothetical protein